MPVYKLHYFDAKGIAEVSRLLLAAAGVEYEDIRIQPEEWPAKKASESRMILIQRSVLAIVFTIIGADIYRRLHVTYSGKKEKSLARDLINIILLMVYNRFFSVLNSKLTACSYK
jgi:hypothetical protein